MREIRKEGIVAHTIDRLHQNLEVVKPYPDLFAAIKASLGVTNDDLPAAVNRATKNSKFFTDARALHPAASSTPPPSVQSVSDWALPRLALRTPYTDSQVTDAGGDRQLATSAVEEAARSF